MNAAEHYSEGEKILASLGKNGYSVSSGIALAQAHFTAALAHASMEPLKDAHRAAARRTAIGI